MTVLPQLGDVYFQLTDRQTYRESNNHAAFIHLTMILVRLKSYLNIYLFTILTTTTDA